MEPRFNLIGAVAVNGVYGKGRGDQGKIPWNVPLDMKFFARTTTGDGNNTVVMSRGMWSALPEKYRPLPKRQNIVVTSSPEQFSAHGAEAVANITQAFSISSGEKVFVCGGHDMWHNARHLVGGIFINIIHTEPEGSDFVLFHQLRSIEKTWPEFGLETETEREEVCKISGVRVHFCFYKRR